MIYSFEIKDFPKSGQYTERITYKDENDYDWVIARVENGFFVAYFGHEYFKEKYFSLTIKGKDTLINNTGCFFIQDTDFETFYDFRNILNTCFTDEIWEGIGILIQDRLEQDSGLLACEIVPYILNTNK